jgi:hypothetical protein
MVSSFGIDNATYDPASIEKTLDHSKISHLSMYNPAVRQAQDPKREAENDFRLYMDRLRSASSL